ncbi:MAG: Gfo/Idh/MocA family oxidoreductase [Angelakisella sp.]|nr:Gfo/Idh/MocA family oxidoreductase [Angelakisella sp.]
MSIKVGVIGTGMMGSSQIRNCFGKLPQYEITAICDNYQPNLDAVSGWLADKGQKVASFTDYKEMLQQADFDLAVIVTPDFAHEEQAVACLNAGKHVRLEKPMATTPQGCKNILEAYQKSGKVLQIGLELRYAYLTRRMQELKERLGSTKMVWCHEFRHPFLDKTGSVKNWIIEKRFSGGTLLEKNCHHFDLFNMVAGAKPVRVYASGDNQVIYQHTDVLDNAFVTVEYENGIRACLSLCMFAPEKKGQKHMGALELGILGDKGRLELKDDELYFWDRDCHTEEHYHFNRSNFEAHSDDITPSLIELAGCIETGTQPYTDIRTGINSAMVGMAAELSAEEKRIVEISEMEKLFGVSFLL